jgi:hypothetical protein
MVPEVVLGIYSGGLDTLFGAGLHYSRGSWLTLSMARRGR